MEDAGEVAEGSFMHPACGYVTVVALERRCCRLELCLRRLYARAMSLALL